MRRVPDVLQADVSWLRARLAEAGYTPETLKRVCGVTVPDDVGLLNRAPALERARGDDSPAAALVRLFFLEADEPARQVFAVLERQHCEALVRSGVLQIRAGMARARVRIDPVGRQYFMADRRFRAFDRWALHLRGRDPVYPPSSDSLTLRDALVVPGRGVILDLCTGSGVQALQQARTAERVVAVDINPRAATMARLNTVLNGVANVEVRCGDLYAPVAPEQFDVIVANPPFVASPYHNSPAYHSGGATGDRVLRRVIAGLGRHLRPGGRAFAISHLALCTGEEIEAVAARWFRKFPGRAVVLVLETGTPVDLAAAQSLFALERGLPAYAIEVARWVAYLRRHRISTVALLLVVAQCGAGLGVEVVQAQPRVLPLPLSPPPVDRLRAWFEEAGRKDGVTQSV